MASKIHDNGKERWVETTLRLQPGFSELYYGLGSRFFRDDSIGDDERTDERPASLPERLEQFEIMRIYREEFSRWGSNNLWTWGDRIGESRHGHVARWLTELIDGAFPGLGGSGK